MTAVIGTVSKSWMSETLGVVFDRQYYFDPRHRHAVDQRCNDYLRERLPDLNLFFTESNLGRLSEYRPRQALVGGLQPNMILGMLVGAEFLPQDHMDADISPTPLAGWDLQTLPGSETLLANECIRRFDQQLIEISQDPTADLEAVPPFFWDGSGRAAIHGPLTTAHKLFGESILMDLMVSPAEAQRTLDWVTESTIDLVDHFASLASRQITEVHVGECSACMVSGELFSRFVVPAISKIGAALGPVRLHSCGTSDHLLEAFLAIKGLHSLDTGGGTSVAAVRRILGGRFRLEIAPLVDDVSSPSSAALLAWADGVMDQNAAGPIAIVYHLERGYDLDHFRSLQKHVCGLDRS